MEIPTIHEHYDEIMFRDILTSNKDTFKCSVSEKKINRVTYTFDDSELDDLIIELELYKNKTLKEYTPYINNWIDEIKDFMEGDSF
jgi:hypothetical protein